MSVLPPRCPHDSHRTFPERQLYTICTAVSKLSSIRKRRSSSDLMNKFPQCLHALYDALAVHSTCALNVPFVKQHWEGLYIVWTQWAHQVQTLPLTLSWAHSQGGSTLTMTTWTTSSWGGGVLVLDNIGMGKKLGEFGQQRAKKATPELQHKQQPSQVQQG